MTWKRKRLGENWCVPTLVLHWACQRIRLPIVTFWDHRGLQEYSQSPWFLFFDPIIFLRPSKAFFPHLLCGGLMWSLSSSPLLRVLLLPARRDCVYQWTRAISQAPDAVGHAGPELYREPDAVGMHGRELYSASSGCSGARVDLNTCQRECQIECQTECQKICQIEYQKECQIECENICHLECQKQCPIECQIECQSIFQK